MRNFDKEFALNEKRDREETETNRKIGEEYQLIFVFVIEPIDWQKVQFVLY